MRHLILPLILILEFFYFAEDCGVSFDSTDQFFQTSLWFFEDVIRQIAPLLILSFGMTIVLMTAGIDLSVASMMALIACLMSIFDMPESADKISETFTSFWYTAVPLGLLIGLTCGYFNGFLIARLDIPPIIATLGTLFFYRGLCNTIMKGDENAPFYKVEGYSWLGEIQGVLVITGLLFLAGGFLFQKSRWRREILMMGGNRVAARYSGIPVHFRTEQVYCFVGFLAFLAALCSTSKEGSVTASSYMGLELQVIVAVVLGGTRVDGGYGTIIGSIWGVLIIAVLQEGLRGISMTTLEPILLGVLLVCGVWVNTHFGSRKNS